MSTPDSNIGDDCAPARYSAFGRETIDGIRDRLGDRGFVAFCRGNAIKYRDRAGRKFVKPWWWSLPVPESWRVKVEQQAWQEDTNKARWYQAMVEHVLFGSPDPRSDRPDFTPYEPMVR